MNLISLNDVEREIAEQEQNLIEQEILLEEAGESDDENISVLKQNIAWTSKILQGLKSIG